jgi:hypothetical protein
LRLAVLASIVCALILALIILSSFASLV